MVKENLNEELKNLNKYLIILNSQNKLSCRATKKRTCYAKYKINQRFDGDTNYLVL